MKAEAAYKMGTSWLGETLLFKIILNSVHHYEPTIKIDIMANQITKDNLVPIIILL